MLEKMRLTLLGLWFGVMAYFSFAVAPAAFAVLPTQQLAGNLVSRTLGITEIIGIALGLFLLVISLITHERRGKIFWFEMVTLFLMTLSMIISRFVISQRMRELRAQSADISVLSSTDPARMMFDQLHHYSVWLMGFNIIAALVLIIIIAQGSSVADGNT